MSAENKSRKWFVLLLLIGLPVAFLPFLAAEINKPTTNLVDQIKEGCQREFGYLGQEFVTRCAYQLTIRKANELHHNALNRAYR